MLTDALVAKKYLAPSLPTFWRWEDDGGAVTLPTGELLAFRPELADALSAFDAGGLPPIGALLLVLDAMKRGWENRAALERLQTACVSIYENAGRYLPAGLQERVALKLGVFHQVVAATDDPAQREAAIRLTFEGCITEVPAGQAAGVVELLRAGPAREMLTGSASHDGFDRLLLDLRTLDAGLDRVTPEALRRFAGTGVEADIQPVEELEALPPACDAARSMIDHLCADEQHAALGKITRDLLAALRLPRGLGRPRDLPLGGLSDITNRGRLDRLLLSELAQDDLTLAVRVANNEALYLRREESRTRPPISRELIIDVGLRQWGVPRLIAVAAALALCAGGDADIEPACHYTTHAGSAPADLLSPEGLENLLGRLEVNLHPAAAIGLAAQRIAAQDAGELVVITHARSLHDPAVIRALSEQQADALYLVAIDGAGRVELLARTAAGMRPLAHTAIDPDDLLDKSRKTLPLTDPAKDGSFPAAIRQRRLPLRIPHQFDLKSAWFSPTRGRCAFVVTGDHRLTMWDRRAAGPIQLSDTLPSGKLHWCAVDTQPAPIDAIIGGVGRGAKLYTLTLDPDNNAVETRPLEVPGDGKVYGVTCHRGAMLLLTSKGGYALDPLSGQVLAQTPDDAVTTRQPQYTEGRFFISARGKWYGMHYDGTDIAVREVRLHQAPSSTPLSIQRIVEAAGVDDIFAISKNGAVYRIHWPDEHAKRNVGVVGTRAQATASRDGRRIRIKAQTLSRGPTWEYFTIQSDSGRGQAVKAEKGHPGDAWLEPEISRLCLRRSARVKFAGAQLQRGNDGEPTLELVSRKDHSALVTGGSKLHLQPQHGAKKHIGYQTFRSIPAPEGTHYKLWAIQFSGAAGSVGLDHHGTLHLPTHEAPDVRKGRLVLDSRGMLHLQPDDTSLGEVTLVFEHNNVSGWYSDGRVFGDRYYFPDPDALQLTGAEAYRELVLPILKRMM